MSIETNLGRVIKSKTLPDGKLQITSHISDSIEPGKIMYHLFYVGEKGAGAIQFSSRYFETLTIEQYQTLFDQIRYLGDLVRLSQEYDHKMDLSKNR